MSIHLSITPKGLGPEAARLVPIAGHEAFRRDWLPVLNELKLFWIPLFETGFPLPLDDRPDVLAELRTFGAWVREHHPEAAERISERIDNLISELAEAEHDEKVELSIG